MVLTVSGTKSVAIFLSWHAYFSAIDLVGHTTVVSSVGKIVDISPPKVGIISIGNGGSENTVLSGGIISFQWEGFTDVESGIQQFLLGVGSTNDSVDVIDFRSIEGSFTRINQSELMIDGYQYYGILKVIQYQTCGIYKNMFVFGFLSPLFYFFSHVIKISNFHLLLKINIYWDFCSGCE